MAKFTDYDFAIRFRNVISKVVEEILDRDRPPDKVGRVVDVDRAAGYAHVIFSGDQANSIRVKMYPNIQPKRSDRVNGEGNGTIVRVTGPAGGRFISQILDDSAHIVNPRFVNPAISTGGSGETTARSFFTFKTDRMPVPNGATKFSIATFHVRNPSNGLMNVYINVDGVVGDTCMQHDLIAWDSDHAREIDTAATNKIRTNSAIGLNTYYNIDTYPHEIEIFLIRDATSMNESYGMTIHVDLIGNEAEIFTVGEFIT